MKSKKLEPTTLNFNWAEMFQYRALREERRRGSYCKARTLCSSDFSVWIRVSVAFGWFAFVPLFQPWTTTSSSPFGVFKTVWFFFPVARNTERTNWPVKSGRFSVYSNLHVFEPGNITPAKHMRIKANTKNCWNSPSKKIYLKSPSSLSCSTSMDTTGPIKILLMNIPIQK